MTSRAGILIAAFLCAFVSACQLTPAQGPLAGTIKTKAGKSATEQKLQTATVFDLVNIDAKSAELVTSYQSRTLSRRFGFGGGGGGAVIGVGDQLRVTIFEAGKDGLFSTEQNKQTSIDLVVQPDGRAAIPYVGSVMFAGRTLEQARQSIRGQLEQKAVQPDVIVTAVATASRTVTVSGAVKSSGAIPLDLKGDQLVEIIAKAGGPIAAPYETYITLNRGKKIGRVLFKSLIDNPSENVYVQPGDQVFLTHDPRTFTVLGETIKNGRIEFGSNDLNLLEAIGLAGGGTDIRADARGYFIFRYEEADIVQALLGRKRFDELIAKGMTPDNVGRYPIAYAIDMSKADSLFVGQTFPIANRDIVYVARHPSVDLTKFFSIVTTPANFLIAASVVGQ